MVRNAPGNFDILPRCPCARARVPRVATRAIARARIWFSAKLFCGALLMSFNYFKNARARSRLVTFKLKAGDCLLLCLLLPHTKLNYIINILLVITTVGSYIIGYIIRITNSNTISISWPQLPWIQDLRAESRSGWLTFSFTHQDIRFRQLE